MRKIKLVLSYDGTPYLGWQKQPGGPTVQGTLESVLSQIYSEPIRTIGSGRTDAGTHAVAQVVHFEAPKILPAEPRLVRALNSLLPETICCKGAWLAPDDFHALASARRKTYIYRIWNSPTRSALWHNRALWVPKPLNVKLLESLARQIIGSKDFKSFQSAGTPVNTTVRTVDVCTFRQVSGHLIEFRIRGNGFLKQMVRNLVGTLLHLERGNGSIDDLRAIFEAKDRRIAKATAPAHGLYLYRVEYPSGLDNKCRKL
jgi:tRNA pseudouridine38-40 synthase